MATVGDGLSKVSLGPAMPYPSMPCGRATPETALQLVQGRSAAVFYPFGHPTPNAHAMKDEIKKEEEFMITPSDEGPSKKKLASHISKSKLPLALKTLIDINGKTRYICEICENFFMNFCQLKRHMKFAHSKKRHSCKMCLKTFGWPSNFRIHCRRGEFHVQAD
jgi:hypothetical protein